MEIIPDKWTVVQLIHNGTSVYKIFATWMGSYLDGDSWKLNSGIESVSDDEKFYYFKGYSGSVYKCHKNHYGIATSFTRNVVENFKRYSQKMVRNFYYSMTRGGKILTSPINKLVIATINQHSLS